MHQASPHKFLVHVTVDDSPGPLRFIAEPEFTIEQVMKRALKEYELEARIPALGTDVDGFELYAGDDLTQALDKQMSIADAQCRDFLLHKREDVQGESKPGEDKAQRKDGGLFHALAERLNGHHNNHV